MKNLYPIALCLLISFTSSFAQNKAELLPEIIKNDIILKKNTTYIIKNDIKINNGINLTIEEGVTLISNSGKKVAFLVNPGARVIACGNSEKPIVAMTNTENPDVASIVIKSTSIQYDEKTSVNKFEYNKIENPTVLYNPTLIREGGIASATPDF